jgi:hypothetical protein
MEKNEIDRTSSTVKKERKRQSNTLLLFFAFTKKIHLFKKKTYKIEKKRKLKIIKGLKILMIKNNTSMQFKLMKSEDAR